MKISVFGLGYVGTVCAACLAERGHQVVGVDKSDLKVGLIQQGRSPIVERDIDDLIGRMVDAGRLSATTKPDEAVDASEISLICVGTPSQPNGALNLESVEAVAGEIGRAIRVKATRHTVVVRSTVTPGTTRGVVHERIAAAAGNVPFRLAFNPEFLREGSAVADFRSPSKTVVGAIEEEAGREVMSLYQDLPGPKISTAIETAEFVKYVDNTWHALKVAFGNEIGMIAKTLGINSHQVMDIFVQDERLNISAAYLRPGFAFGGSCLPKDLRALTYLGRKLDVMLPVLGQILESNRQLVEHAVEWIISNSSRRIAFLGVSFKSGTDDVRESPFIELVERLLGKGREIRIFDPNVRLAQLTGANKAYLMQALPHIAELIVSTASEAIGWADTIVVTSSDPAYTTALNAAQSDHVILEFAHLNGKGPTHLKTQGFLW